MCGRFALTLPPDAMAALFEATPANDLRTLPDYNICPTTPIPAVINTERRRLQSFRWGFIPHWYKSPTDGPLLINARAETIATKPAFGQAVRHRRALVPADGFYEWTKSAEGERLPWFVQRRDEQPMVFAAIWQNWQKGDQDINSLAIVTTEAGPDIAAIHHRQPLILEPGQWPLWLGEAGHGAARLMQPSPKGQLQAWRVDKAVNSNRASGAALSQPLE